MLSLSFVEMYLKMLWRKTSYNKLRPTKRAPDAGDSGEISSSFLRLIIFHIGRRSVRPSAGNARVTIGLALTN